jgi:hypothetical protein
MTSVPKETKPEAALEAHTPPDFEKGHVVDPTVPVTAPQNNDQTIAILELVKANDVHHPIHWPTWKRWGIIFVYCFLQLFVAMTSTTYIGVEYLIQEKWGGSTQVVTLGQSLFIVGNAVGPAFMGPLSYVPSFSVRTGLIE